MNSEKSINEERLFNLPVTQMQDRPNNTNWLFNVRCKADVFRVHCIVKSKPALHSTNSKNTSRETDCCFRRGAHCVMVVLKTA